MIRVFVVDDSAYNRRTIVKILESDPEIRVVGTASNGEEALKAVAQVAPDVITLDLEMPGLDGFDFLRIFLRRFFVPVVVVSSRSEDTAVFKALELGAVDFIPKPTQQNSPQLWNIQQSLIEKVKGVYGLKSDKIAAFSESRLGQEEEAISLLEVPSPEDAKREYFGEREILQALKAGKPQEASMPQPIIAIGASTGGPAAIQRILSHWKAESQVAMVVAVHMPPDFTNSFARRLNELSVLTVKEAENGDWIAPGRVLIAPGGFNLAVRKSGSGVLKARAHVEPVRAVDKYIPSVNRLFESVAETYGDRCLAVVLTGMGDDGTQGASLIHKAGGNVIVESEETAVIFGMPRQVMASGYAHRVLGLPSLIHYLHHWVAQQMNRS